jgi:tetratricopeptide (TPR) repeat protein
MAHWRFGIVAAVAAFVLCLPGAQAASAQDQADELEITALDLEAKGDLDGAILKHRDAVKLVPKNKAFKENFAKTLNAAAIAKHEAKDDVTAIAYLQEALAVTPNFKQAQDNLFTLKTGKINAEGAALFKNGDFAGAVAKFNEVLAISPDYKPARINRDAAEAQIAIAAGDPATAVAKLTEATTLDPTSAFLKGKLADAQTAADAKAAEEAKKRK